MILSLGALTWGVSRGRKDSGSRWSRWRRRRSGSGYSMNVGALFGVTLLGSALKTWAILNRVISIAAIHAEFVGKAALSFLLGYGAAGVRRIGRGRRSRGDSVGSRHVLVRWMFRVGMGRGIGRRGLLSLGRFVVRWRVGIMVRVLWGFSDRVLGVIEPDNAFN